MCTFQTFLRNLLRDELKKLNIQSFNLSVFLHRRKGDINGVKMKEAYFKAVADLTSEEYFEDLKKSRKSKMNSEAFDSFIEVDPAEFVIKDRNSIMVTISDPQSKRKAERFKGVHAITKVDDEQTIESVRTPQKKADYMKKAAEFNDFFDVVKLVNSQRKGNRLDLLTSDDLENVKSPKLKNELQVSCCCGLTLKLNAWLNISHFGVSHWTSCKSIKAVCERFGGSGTIKKVTTGKRQFKSTNEKAVPKKHQKLSQKPVKDTVTVKTAKSASILSYMNPIKRSQPPKK